VSVSGEDDQATITDDGFVGRLSLGIVLEFLVTTRSLARVPFFSRREMVVVNPKSMGPRKYNSVDKEGVAPMGATPSPSCSQGSINWSA
jgi:hypothetical protein